MSGTSYVIERLGQNLLQLEQALAAAHQEIAILREREQTGGDAGGAADSAPIQPLAGGSSAAR